MKAYLVGKGKSLDNVTANWFDGDFPIWCLNQSATVIYNLLKTREIHCIQNDPWIKYTPPQGVVWHCSLNVPVDDRNVLRYNPETLTGNWANPTCICALELMKQAGFKEIIMIGFDSHFDGSRTYAEALKVKSDCIAPFEYYDTIIRRWADRNGIILKWVDENGLIHNETHKYKKCILGVAKGDKFEKQTNRMIDSFIKYNSGWEVEKFYGERLESILPKACKTWSDFNKCELGRWLAMRDLLNIYDTVLYCDGDVRWYAEYENHDIEMVLTPHTVTKRASANMRHQLMKDGLANIGIVEVNRGVHHDMIFDFVIGETLHDPARFSHGKTLWLQNLVSCCSDVGFEVLWNDDPSVNVASWNIRKGDRTVIEKNGRFYVVCDGKEYALKSFHFSSKSLHMLRFFGDAVVKLLEDYLNE